MSQPPLLTPGPPDNVVDVDIAARMEQSFLDYSMSVIVGRALPDVRDGLKPVQRRILYSMWEGGLRPDRPYRKCASAVGDVMKKYHPHGDSSIYEALVRMAQPFATREPLVDGHGNFGSVDGDAPAAMRYTEARLSAIAMELLAGIDEDTVDVVPNYDGYETEPAVLPARFPNLLVNGASGIAVGMATNVAPHNLGEVIDACRHLLAFPDATLDDVMEIVPAPDFPTGARIVAGDGIREAYATGRGAITMEAVAATETRSGGLPRIVVTELPYGVNKSVLLERIADLVKNRRLEAVRDLRDETSRDGMRVVIELKRGEDPARVLAALYRLTDLRRDFNANVVALDGGAPKTLGLLDCLRAYLAHQRVVLTRRSTFRRNRAAARAHVLEGLLLALDAIDEVIALIRASDSSDEARTGLVERFGLTEVQATAILDMQLRRLAALERRKLADELAALRAAIRELDRILSDPSALDELLDGELAEVRTRHANPRRSRILTTPVGAAPGATALGATAAGPSTEPVAVLEAQSVLLTATAGSYVRAVAERPTSPAHGVPRDPLVAALRATTEATLLLVDADGTGVRVPTADVAVVTARQRGSTVAQLTGALPGPALAGAVVLERSPSLLTVSAAGLVKRTARSEYEGRTRTMIAAGVRDDDALVAVLGCDEADELLLAHSGGLVIRFPVADVREMGRSATGVAGMAVPAGASVVAASVVPAGTQPEVVTLGADGSAKRSPLEDYPVQGRGGKGVQTGVAPLAWCGVAGDLHVPVGEEWTVLRAEVLAVARRSGRPAPATAPVTGRVVREDVGR